MKQIITNILWLVADICYVLIAIAGTIYTFEYIQEPLLEIVKYFNICTMVLYFYDKWASEQRPQYWRISKDNLILAGKMGGWIGAIFAQQLARHKTRKRRFQWRFIKSIVLNTTIVTLYVLVESTIF